MLKKLLQKLLGKKEEPTFYVQKLEPEANLSLQEKVDHVLLGFYGAENLQKLKNFELKLDSKPFQYKGLSFDTFGWTEEETAEEHHFFWSCEDYPIGLSLDYFPLVPDLPVEKNIDTIRNDYWERGVPILKCDFRQIKEVTSVENLFKTVCEDKVVQYNANIIIPFDKQSFVLKLIAEDYINTGLRDATVYPLVCDDIMDMSNATIYLYDETKAGKMTLSEKEEFDYLLPFHHLTILRKVLPKFIESISFDETLQNTTTFYP